MAMNACDLENLASMLDKNRTFERPQGQATGFSLQEHAAAPLAGSSSTSASSNALVATTTTNATVSEISSSTSSANKAKPSGIALPPTVVDHQLRLPEPSHGKAAERRRQLATPAAPHGDEIWTQAELKERYIKQQRDGPAPLVAVARAVAAAHHATQQQQRQQNGGALWRPSPSEVGTYEEPVYTVLYQQNLSAEDVYLGVDFTRDASSAASDGVTVRVELPKVTTVSAIATEVDPYELRVSVAGVYYLTAALPRKVQRTAADAVWDGQKKLLTVRLKADQSDTDVKLVL
jgi:dynein assembly factor 6, axonemal